MNRFLAASLGVTLVLSGCGNDTPSQPADSAGTVAETNPPLALAVEDECASVIADSSGEVVFETCMEAGAGPTLLWSGTIGDGGYGLMRTRPQTRFESVSPASRLIQFGPDGEFALIEFKLDPVTTVVVRQESTLGDVVLECAVPNSLVECEVVEQPSVFD